ncbi:hypothetical protein LTR91_013226 [Friedmanniomyces endolithicus]|uniref:NADAR domain-containing protein n=1 Tax=Friedmanniomyces endolithicus TaxID=329885 RepID=A0AAN6KE60_9PEZI|nr:hypothetical protein LTR94_008788 [Friedmanniomyces endolithicus]KAK0786107.1 hypothetical protein LTR59_010842 [Friedmanniomyces endolithicus]KAK0790591.1 hypothetical protein LTR38_010526 [Friedmanniomyces endolithicus]KAK0879471.1 hypothetical protein LTR87_006710 [Friedmanniomyces endolithicus]KAK0918533.1 hypothetical protein LTR57_011669 [Friedmanniomyces endolithicus]
MGKLAINKRAAKVSDASPSSTSTRKPKHADKSGSDLNSQSAPRSLVTFFFHEAETNGFLCQWYRCTFTDPEYDGVSFNCAEQYMMYRKALLFKDTATAAEILKTTSPRKQKGLGRQIQGYDQAKWEEARIAIVQRGNLLKFSQCTNVASMKMDDVGEPVPLKSLLLATGVHDLVEASPFDEIWGIGFKAEVALSVSRAQWGQNLLGKALMYVREELRETG